MAKNRVNLRTSPNAAVDHRHAAGGLVAGFLCLHILSGGSGAAELPGERFVVSPDQLAKPYATASASNPPAAAERPQPPPLLVPPGFTVGLFAEGLDHARWLTMAGNGDVLVAESGAGKVTLLRDTDGDGRADLVTPYAVGFRRPHGLAVVGDWLYVADTRRVWRLPWDPSVDHAPARPEPVTEDGALHTGAGHWTRGLIFSRDGARFFVAIGSERNIAEESVPRATVQSFAAAGGDRQTYAAGLRNPVGMALYPGTDDVYVVVNERDGLGDGLVPDYLTRLQPGGFYGWPYAYIGGNPQPKLAPRPDLVAKTIVPDLLFEAHSAPLGLVFYDGAQFPAEYRGDAFVALHGSWNAATPTGYKVVRVPFENGRPVGQYENFVTGFRLDNGDRARVWGRPAGLAVAADGSLLIADDVGQVIWRVSYRP